MCGVAWRGARSPSYLSCVVCTRQNQLIAAVFGKEMPSLVVRTFVFGTEYRGVVVQPG